MKNIVKLIVMLICQSFWSNGQSVEQLGFEPKHYICIEADTPIIIDGQFDEIAWQSASWTDLFVDIEGNKKPKPLQDTRVKMLWDDQYFYIAARLEETDLWATYDQRDAVIYHENDFEVFIDPDGDTHNYYELEINALGTVWDLMLVKPYRDGGPALNSWDIEGLKKGIHLNGTLNNPMDQDHSWQVEMAIPWQALNPNAKGGQKPATQDTWRVNFSRVNWQIENQSGKYSKKINPDTGNHFPEFNWVWSAQGVIAMHQPETWGFVTFVEDPNDQPTLNLETELIKWKLRKVYYAQKKYMKSNGNYAKSFKQLDIDNAEVIDFKLSVEAKSFEAKIVSKQLTWRINHQGRVWSTANKKTEP